ncbi:class I SAM-dependent methyltransferase [Luteithermobacter gelatinilyticus]|uniref:class I SAM-dependent methyltransferase n=1 Tax=Luteithermobacter gelatinilyticus TaxID=2582913 RepID=UPI001106DFB1|nr:SAM-dependent methyltransferase [Luteithermobacter gelatinilyticus]
MKADRASHTADFAAAIRATYQYRPEKVLHEDPFAIDLTSPLFRFIVKTPFLRRLIMEKYFLRRLGASLTILSRARYAEEYFHNAYRQGIRQVLVLGAGLDAFALKFAALPETLAIYELDHPNTQATKQQRLAARQLRSPHQHHFIPIDFSRDSIADVLSGSTIELSRPVYVSWMGMTYYLRKSDILETLKALDRILAPGSHMTFDYMDERLFDDTFLVTDPVLKKSIKVFFEFTEKHGEPLLTGFSKSSLKELLEETNWTLTDSINGRENTAKYLHTTPDFLWPTEFDHLAHIELQPHETPS